jgi:hypothetical protein
MMSGLMDWPPGPRDENVAIVSPVPMTFVPAVNVAVLPG